MNLFMVVAILVSLGASADAAKPPAPEMPAVPDVIGEGTQEPYYPLENPPVYVPVAPSDDVPPPEAPATPGVIGDIDPFAPQPLDPMGDLD